MAPTAEVHWLRRNAARIALATLIVVLVVVTLEVTRARSGKTQRAVEEGCRTADTQTSNARYIQRSMLCLHNVERHEHGLSGLRWSSSLARVARAHARDMVARRYFAHSSRAGRDHVDRIAASSYRPRRGCWTGAENLLESNGPSTPRKLWETWLNSPGHRTNIVHKGWRDFGLGVVGTSPEGDREGLTLVALFGARSERLCR